MMQKPVIKNNISIELPYRDVMARLGYHKHFTDILEKQKQKIDKIINEAFLNCKLDGVWARVKIKSKPENKVILEDNTIWESKDIIKFLVSSKDIYFIAATAGADIVRMRDEFLESGDTMKAVIYDAVGSETADAALDWIHRFLSKKVRNEARFTTDRRYSAGYGDFSLAHQAYIHNILELEKLGITINENFILKPEKTVTALVGVI